MKKFMSKETAITLMMGLPVVLGFICAQLLEGGCCMAFLYVTFLFIAGTFSVSALVLVDTKKTEKTINSALDDGYALGFKHGREVEQEKTALDNLHQEPKDSKEG